MFFSGFHCNILLALKQADFYCLLCFFYKRIVHPGRNGADGLHAAKRVASETRNVLVCARTEYLECLDASDPITITLLAVPW